MEKDLSIEKNWRLQLQNDLSEKNDLVKEGNNKLEILNQTQLENKVLKEEQQVLKGKVNDLELTLEEMGSKLGTYEPSFKLNIEINLLQHFVNINLDRI